MMEKLPDHFSKVKDDLSGRTRIEKDITSNKYYILIAFSKTGGNVANRKAGKMNPY